MNAFLSRLAEPAPLLLDGGLGTMLMNRGLPAGAPPERWVLERPEELLAVHRAYVQAGSEAIHCCSFGANTPRLAPFGLQDRWQEINRQAVALARQAQPRFVLGDVGPSGEYLPPVGRASQDEWRDAFLEQGGLLAEAGVDAFHIETMSDQREALTALRALREVAPDLPVMVSLTFDKKKRGFFTIMGDRLTPTLCALAEEGAAVVGANCTLTSPDMRALAEEALAAADLPLVLQPNAGQPQPSAQGVRYDQRPEVFADDMAAMAALGVAVVGGCCGSDPRFIQALRQRLDGART